MGLGSSTLQRAASEIIGFPSARTDENSSEHGEAGADRSSEHHNTFPVALNKSPADGGMTPLKRSARLKDSRGTLARCDTDGKDRTASNDGSCESTTRQSSRRGALSRSLADRIESPEFTPFGGSTVSEQPAFVPIPVDTVTPPEPFDADFMMSGTTRAVRSDGSSGKSLGPTVEAPTARKACDNCVRRKTRCDRNIPCAHCINRNEKCHQSAPTPRHAKTVSPPRCRREGCSEPPLHGRRGGRPLWCRLHFVSQNSHQPLRCAVLQRTVSGHFLACWRETTWGWPGKPPTRCERHKTEGQQRLEFVRVVSLLRGVFVQVVWPELLERGWRKETARCKSHHSLWMPPNVHRGNKDFKAGVDFFNRVDQVIKYCLRTEEHHGWMMKVYQQLAQLPTTVSNAETDGGSQRSSSCVTPGRTVGLVSAGAELQPVADGRSPSYTRNSSPRGGASFTQQAMHQSEPRDEPQQPSPATTKGFTHQLFSVTASPERTVHDGNGGISGTSRIMDRLCPVHVDTVPPGRSANVGVLQPPRPAQRHIPVYTSHQAARLRAQGLDPTLVTRMGLACSEEVLAGCLARMAGGGGRVGGPMAALAASLRGLDGPVSGQEHAAASASRSSPKRRCAEISVPNVHHKQLERSRDLAQLARNGQSSVVSQTRQNGASEQQVHGTAIEGVNAPLNGSAKAGLGHALAEEEETPAGAQVQQRCDTTASCETTATEEQNADPERANHEQDRARNSSREPSKKRKAGCLAETSNMLSQAATLADFARKKSFTVGTSD